MNRFKFFAAFILLCAISTPAYSQNSPKTKEAPDIKHGIGKVIALLSTKDTDIPCQVKNSIIETIKNQYTISHSDLIATKTSDCTNYTYNGLYLGKSCCPQDTELALPAKQKGVAAGTAQTISAITPNSGDIGGSNNVIIHGTNFDRVVRVSFGSVPATNAVSYGSFVIVSTPAHAPGTVSVSVTSQCGVTTTAFNAYTYSAMPAISSIPGNSGHVGGSSSVMLLGSNFSSSPSVPRVTIGGLNASNVSTSVGGSALTFEAPPHAAGAVDIVVTNASGPSTTLYGGYTYSATPTITSLLRNSGHIDGSESLTIMGTNFSETAGLPTVTFGGVAGTNVYVHSSGRVLFVDPPAHAAGTVSITLTNSGGQSVTAPNAYTYSTIPIITSLAASSGDTHGSVGLTIYGANFAMHSGTPTVRLGGTDVSSVTSYGSSLVVSPASHASGTVSLYITNPEGPSATLSTCYTYSPQPTISSATPATGSSNGTRNVALSGYNFSYYPNVPTVTFGGIAGTNVRVYNNGRSLGVDAPPHVPEAVPVVVTNSGGNSATLNSYTYAGPLCPVADLLPVLPLLLLDQ